ncbi:type 1 glutamine amidotransferase domain-containing protein [Blastomonas fulva]|uniref:type 1 glutamine amidotransferase domain-containing protein n=1 Tax=Blastomonas fulva TaxID=1550728 RepID=UPI0025A46EF2|nr:type 1 glutamine amidotransferase domain-containing protein [Blastomonas fulva]MDM7927251.1 type 1 glutamine amidotransferase domain-containing protein [Blastomonas fulva]MDM7966368.1 type 1 glutamine amidotransferase domain-containing protein [Blastomonas fulva]
MLLRITTMLTFALAWLVFAPANATTSQNNRVLLVISGHGQEEGKVRPGFEMDELTQAYAVFVDNGLQVDIASPAGGAVVADKFNRDKPYNRRFLADSMAAAKLTATRSIASLDKQDYAAIFIIGGKGAMFDLPVDVQLKALLARIYQAGGVVGAVCHGPAVLMNVSLQEGTSLLEGRSVTGFSNKEEALFGKGWAPAFPVLLENGLRGSGAKFSDAPMMLSHVVTDGRLVTGQNPYSTAAAAEAVIRAMGRTPAPRQPWADERSILLLGQMLNGDAVQARAAFNADPTLYDVPLIAMWGFFRAQSAGSDRGVLTNAVDVMELALPHFSRPELVSAIAEARNTLATMP